MNTYRSTVCVESEHRNKDVNQHVGGDSGCFTPTGARLHHGPHTGKPGRLVVEDAPADFTGHVPHGDVETARPVLPGRIVSWKKTQREGG